MADHWGTALRPLGNVTIEDGNRVSVALKGQRRPGLDFSQLPADAIVTLTGRDAREPLEVTGAHGAQQLEVQLPIELTIRGGLGRLVVSELVSGVTVSITIEEETSVDRLVIDCSGAVQVQQGTVTVAELRSGHLQGAAERFGTVELAGNGIVPSEVARLCLTGDSVALPSSGDVAIGELTCRLADGSTPTLALPRRERGDRKVTITQVAAEVRLKPHRGTTVIVEGNSSPFEVASDGDFAVPAGATVADVTLIDPVSTSVGRDATLLRVAGDLRARSCANASILAAPGGHVTYRGLAPGNARAGGATGIENATLRGVQIEANAVGRRHLRELADAAVVEPDLEHLPAFGSWRIPLVRRRLIGSDERRRELNDTALFIQELAGLVEQRCGSGSVRTKAAWAAYRARQLDSSSWGERLALGLFRIVGYGQRPGPPLLCWALLAAVLTPAFLLLGGSLADLDNLRADLGPALPMLWPQFIELLLSPLVLLRLAGDPALAPLDGLDGLLVVLLRTVIAAPFVFFVVATSRFLRADWISASFRATN